MNNQSALSVNRVALLISLLCIAVFSELSGAQDIPVMEEIVVFGRNTNQVGEATSASIGYIGGADLLIRPLVRPQSYLSPCQAKINRDK